MPRLQSGVPTVRWEAPARVHRSAMASIAIPPEPAPAVVLGERDVPDLDLIGLANEDRDADHPVGPWTSRSSRRRGSHACAPRRRPPRTEAVDVARDRTKPGKGGLRNPSTRRHSWLSVSATSIHVSRQQQVFFLPNRGARAHRGRDRPSARRGLSGYGPSGHPDQNVPLVCAAWGEAEATARSSKRGGADHPQEQRDQRQDDDSSPRRRQ